MNNPWLKLPKEKPFILQDDFEVLQNKIDLLKNVIHPELLPVPYIGDINKASIVLLCLNPGYNKELDDVAYSNNDFLEESIKSLNFSSQIPFYCLDSRFSFTGGYLWWRKILNDLLKKFGENKVLEKLMCVQYFPYHSKKYYHLPFTLPSQDYSFNLVKQAISDNKTIIIMRSKKHWFNAIPELEHYPYIELKNYRRPFITENNLLNKSDYSKIISALDK